MVASRPAPTVVVMTRRASSTRLPALGAAVVLLGASGLAACSGAGTEGPVAPIVMTDGDGVLHGPAKGATPVSPADPAPAGRDVVTAPPQSEQETGTETEPVPPPAPSEPDDDPVPPPPRPAPSPDDDTDEADDDTDGGSDDGDDDTPDGADDD